MKSLEDAPMRLVLSAAGLAEIPESELQKLEFLLFLLSLTPAAVYLAVAALYWFCFAKKRTMPRFALIVSPVAVWLVYGTLWPSWWIYAQ